MICYRIEVDNKFLFLLKKPNIENSTRVKIIFYILWINTINNPRNLKLPKKYLTKNPNVMKREIKKHSKKRDDDQSAYGPWDADYKSRKAGKGKPIETKPSKYTKKYKEMFEESREFGYILDWKEFNKNIQQ